MLSNKVQDEIKNADVDWSKIKEILDGIAKALQAVAMMIPVDLIKNILLGIAAGINLVISWLPDDKLS